MNADTHAFFHVGPWSDDAAHIQGGLPSSVKPLWTVGYTQCVGDTQFTVSLLGVNAQAMPTCLPSHYQSINT